TIRPQVRALALLIVLSGCRSRDAEALDEPPPAPKKVAPADARGATGSGATAGSGANDFAELASFPRTDPLHVVALPAKSTTPRFDVGGPAVLGEIAVVSSSQFGFIAVDIARGQIAWTKPAGIHVAPPLARANGFVLIGECLSPPEVPDK